MLKALAPFVNELSVEWVRGVQKVVAR
jgi:hypothetical protein